jgi:glyoxylase-like metal-dependent hydrolase (beta-lactamase superfamily II)
VTGRWLELTDGVFARRYAELDLTVGLVVGAERALVIDTRGDGTQGAELAEAVRTITGLPLAVAITHAHFDHCFGTAAFLDAAGGPYPVYAQRGCAGRLRDTAEEQRAHWTRYYRQRDDQDTAAALADARVLLPDTPVDQAAEVDLGGRVARLLHPGPGHTDHDLAVHLPDVNLLFAGDLVEEGAPPAFEDAHPLRWPDALDTLLSLRPELVVPGHGDPVPTAFVAGQRAELITVAELCRAVAAGELPRADAEAISPYPAATTRAALARVEAGRHS